MGATVHNFTGDEKVKQGTSWAFQVTFNDLDLTGATVRGQIRRTPTDPTVLADFSTYISYDTKWHCLVSLTPTSSGAIPVNNTTSHKFKTTTYCYDLEVELQDGTVVPLLEGDIEVSPGVTRD